MTIKTTRIGRPRLLEGMICAADCSYHVIVGKFRDHFEVVINWKILGRKRIDNLDNNYYLISKSTAPTQTHLDSVYKQAGYIAQRLLSLPKWWHYYCVSFNRDLVDIIRTIVNLKSVVVLMFSLLYNLIMTLKFTSIISFHLLFWSLPRLSSAESCCNLAWSSVHWPWRVYVEAQLLLLWT